MELASILLLAIIAICEVLRTTWELLDRFYGIEMKTDVHFYSGRKHD